MTLDEIAAGKSAGQMFFVSAADLQMLPPEFNALVTTIIANGGGPGYRLDGFHRDRKNSSDFIMLKLEKIE